LQHLCVYFTTAAVQDTAASAELDAATAEGRRF
jgi:hypothetical protein